MYFDYGTCESDEDVDVEIEVDVENESIAPLITSTSLKDGSDNVKRDGKKYCSSLLILYCCSFAVLGLCTYLTVTLGDSTTETVDQIISDMGYGILPIRASLALFAVINGCVLVMVSFERFRVWTIKKSKGSLQPIVHSLCAKLTVLGFMSLATSAFTNIFSLKEIYTDMLENVHFPLFAIMVLYTVLVLYLLGIGSAEIRLWEKKNAYVQKPGVAQTMQDNLEEIGPDSVFDIIWPRFGLVSCCQKMVSDFKDLRFYSLRKEFIENRQLRPPYKFEDPLPKDFDYGRYLAICYGHTIARALELPPVVWLMLWGMTATMIGILIITKDLSQFAWIFAMAGYGVLGFSILIIRKAENILNMSMNLADFPKEIATKFYERHVHNFQPFHDEKYNLLFKKSPVDDSSSISKPLWISEKDTLHWHRKEGDEFLLGGLRFALIFQAIYSSIVLGYFISFIYENDGWQIGCVYAVFSLIPLLLMLGSVLKYMTMLIVHATSIGPYRKGRSVAEVIRFQKTQRAVQAMVLVNDLAAYYEKDEHGSSPMAPRNQLRRSSLGWQVTKLAQTISGENLTGRPPLSRDSTFGKLEKQGSSSSIGSGSSKTNAQKRKKNRRSSLAYISHQDKIKVESAEELFVHFDTEGKGELERAQIEEILSHMGMHFSDAKLQKLMRSLDTDGNGTVSKEEFVQWHYTYTMRSTTYDPHEIGTKLFNIFDKEHNGVLTPSQFKVGLKNIGASLSDEEMDDLVRELDANDDREIDCDEFIGLLEKYYHVQD